MHVDWNSLFLYRRQWRYGRKPGFIVSDIEMMKVILIHYGGSGSIAIILQLNAEHGKSLLYTKELREIIKVLFRSKSSHCGNRGHRDIFFE